LYDTFTSNIEPKTIAVALKNAGYRTGMFGKYVNSYNGSHLPVGWTKWFAATGSTGHYFGPKVNEDGHRTQYADNVATTDLISQAVVKFINEAAKAGSPFYSWVSYHAPHVAPIPDPEYANSLLGLKSARTPAYNEADVSDKPAYVRNKSLASSSTIAGVDSRHHTMGQTLLSVQDGVKAIIGALEATSQLVNTYVIFGSDNGWMHLEHRLAAGKGLPYEQVARIPLFMRGPNIPAGVSLDHLVSNVDLPVTFAQWAGATFSGVDGRSLVPLFSSDRRVLLHGVLLFRSSTKRVQLALAFSLAGRES
jgi:arylsulfatase A-like enzyme